jgi:hypothetical protein
MNEQPTNPKLPGVIEVLPSAADFGIQPRDYIYALEVDFDVDAQLMAISGLLYRNRNANQSLLDEIKKIEEHTRRLKGVEAEWAVADWVDQINYSTYQAAAHSMSAVGMLAPLVETVFYQCFQNIGKRFYLANHPAQKHHRWKAAHSIQWDCHWFVDGTRLQKNLAQGIFQLSDAVGLTARYPADLRLVLSALFAYRNNIFHLGFEWPADERDRFAKRIEDKGWPKDWFEVATTGGKPWMFALSDEFIRHCVRTIEQVLQAIGGFVRDELLAKETSS